MSAHTGVSCDACMRTNFPGRRYKCLLCDNYDLCGACYDIDAESQNHKSDHAMQCILTEATYEIFYAGETVPRRTAVSLTCPHCGLAGFIPRTLLTHCLEKHPSTSVQDKSQAVMCPICVTSPTHSSRSRFALLADHIVTAHDEESMGGEDPIPSSSMSHTRRGENEEEDSDDDDEEPSLNDLEHRAFIEEEHRRQEAARQRLAHASSLAAVIRNDYTATLAGSTNPSRRPLSRQAAIRGSRGGLRGHFTSYPYGFVPRIATGLASGTTTRPPTDTSAGNSSLNDPYTSFAFTQDPMFEFVSRLVNNQSSSSSTASSNTPSTNQFLFGPPIPAHASALSTATPAELARLQQQIDNNESVVQIKSTLLNAKQKRSSQNQQSSSQPMILTHPSGYDYQLWQQQFPVLQPSMNNLGYFSGIIPNDSTMGNSNLISSLSKHSQQSYREHDQRSLLGKILRNNPDVNDDQSDETRTKQQQDHISYLQSILLSTMITKSNGEHQDENHS